MRKSLAIMTFFGPLTAAGVALADDDCSVPMAQWQPRTTVETMAQAQGWTRPLAELSSAALHSMVATLKAWRIQPSGTLGYAKAEVVSREVIADHATNTVDAVITVNPGRLAAHGPVRVTGTGIEGIADMIFDGVSSFPFLIGEDGGDAALGPGGIGLHELSLRQHRDRSMLRRSQSKR